jgi:uncharacterized protein (TIGR02186 family)
MMPWPRSRFAPRLAPLLVAALGMTAAASARAETLVADLSEHLVQITTGFTGARVLLFGALEEGGDVIVVVRGPSSDVQVRRKSRQFGVWVNTEGVTYANVPGYYAVAASKPLPDILPPAIAKQEQVGTEHLVLKPDRTLDPARAAAFRAALIRARERDGLFPPEIGPVRFLGRRLFRAEVTFPKNVPTGRYMVKVLQMREGGVVAATSVQLYVQKAGISARVYDFAHRNAIFYGLLAILLAGGAGWAGSQFFRKS